MRGQLGSILPRIKVELSESKTLLTKWVLEDQARLVLFLFHYYGVTGNSTAISVVILWASLKDISSKFKHCLVLVRIYVNNLHSRVQCWQIILTNEATISNFGMYFSLSYYFQFTKMFSQKAHFKLFKETFSGKHILTNSGMRNKRLYRSYNSN